MGIIKFFEDNVNTIIATIAGGIISYIISYIFYKKDKNKSILAYQTNSDVILNKDNQINLDDIKITYNNKEISNLSKSYIIIWNMGNKTIEGKDIVEDDKLRIVFNGDDGEILYPKIIKTTRNVIKFNANKIDNKNKEVEINFDYLDVNDGAFIEILHTFQKAEPIIEGTIKGMPNGIKNLGYTNDLIKKSKLERIFSKVFETIVFFIGGLSLIIFSILVLILKCPHKKIDLVAIIVSIFYGIFIIIATMFNYKVNNSKFPEKLKLDKNNKKIKLKEIFKHI